MDVAILNCPSRSAVSSQEKIALQDTVTVGREKVVVVK